MKEEPGQSEEQEVITLSSDDDSTSEQPAEKNSRREFRHPLLPSSPPLQEELDDLRKRIQNVTEENEKLALENITVKAQFEDAIQNSEVEKNRAVDPNENLTRKKEMAELKYAEIIKNKIVELSHKNATLKEELDEVVKQAAVEKNRAVLLTHENVTFKKEVEELRRNLLDATSENQRLVLDNCSLKDQVDELSKKDEEKAIVEKQLLARENVILKDQVNDLKIIEEIKTVEIDILKKQIDESKRDAAGERELIERENVILKKQLDEMRKKQEDDKFSESSKQFYEVLLDTENSKSREAELMAQNFTLKEKLVETQMALVSAQNSYPVPSEFHEKITRYLCIIADPIDIFQLCRPDSFRAISLENAVDQIRAKFVECGEEKWRKYCDDSRLNVTLSCGVCQKKLNKYILEHFLSIQHTSAVHAHGAAVSLPALQHWLRELQQAEHASQLLQQVSVAAAPVQQLAAVASSESSMQLQQPLPKTEPVIEMQKPANANEPAVPLNEPLLVKEELDMDISDVEETSNGKTDTINFFQLCSHDAPNSISFDSALVQIRKKFHWEKWRKFWEKNSEKYATLFCEACDTTTGFDRFQHFLSKSHAEKVRALAAKPAISLPALQHWLQVLQQAEDAAKPVQQVEKKQI